MPSAVLSDPEVTSAEIAAMEFDVDQLNALRRWNDLLGKYLRTNPTPVSKEAKKQAEAEAKAKAAADKKAAEAEAKAQALLDKAKEIRSGKTPAKAAKKTTKKAAKKAPAKRGRK